MEPVVISTSIVEVSELVWDLTVLKDHDVLIRLTVTINLAILDIILNDIIFISLYFYREQLFREPVTEIHKILELSNFSHFILKSIFIFSINRTIIHIMQIYCLNIWVSLSHASFYEGQQIHLVSFSLMYSFYSHFLSSVFRFYFIIFLIILKSSTS